MTEIVEESVIDISVRQLERPDIGLLFDIDLDEQGDLLTEESFDTALKMSFFCERRASAAEEPIPEKRRGWIGNEANDVQGFEIGSKLWLLFQSRLDLNTLNEAVDYTNQGLQWFIDDKLLKSFEIRGRRTVNELILEITLFRFNNRVDSRLFKIWNNTGTLENAN